jgi:hypothetical protein
MSDLDDYHDVLNGHSAANPNSLGAHKGAEDRARKQRGPQPQGSSFPNVAENVKTVEGEVLVGSTLLGALVIGLASPLIDRLVATLNYINIDAPIIGAAVGGIVLAECLASPMKRSRIGIATAFCLAGAAATGAAYVTITELRKFGYSLPQIGSSSPPARTGAKLVAQKLMPVVKDEIASRTRHLMNENGEHFGICKSHVCTNGGPRFQPNVNPKDDTGKIIAQAFVRIENPKITDKKARKSNATRIEIIVTYDVRSPFKTPSEQVYISVDASVQQSRTTGVASVPEDVMAAGFQQLLFKNHFAVSSLDECMAGKKIERRLTPDSVHGCIVSTGQVNAWARFTQPARVDDKAIISLPWPLSMLTPQ